MPPGRLWGELPRAWPLAGHLNPLSMSARSSRSGSSALDAYALSKLLWSDDSEDEHEVEYHLFTNATNFDLVSGTRTDLTKLEDDDGTDNPDETEVDGLIDTFEVGLPERSFTRIASWRAAVVRPGDFDFMSKGQVLSLPSTHKRKRSSIDLRGQPPFKVAKLMVDQPICPACNSTFVSKNNLLKHGRRARASEACREAINYAFE